MWPYSQAHLFWLKENLTTQTDVCANALREILNSGLFQILSQRGFVGIERLVFDESGANIRFSIKDKTLRIDKQFFLIWVETFQDLLWGVMTELDRHFLRSWGPYLQLPKTEQAQKVLFGVCCGVLSRDQVLTDLPERFWPKVSQQTLQEKLLAALSSSNPEFLCSILPQIDTAQLQLSIRNLVYYHRILYEPLYRSLDREGVNLSSEFTFLRTLDRGSETESFPEVFGALGEALDKILSNAPKGTSGEAGLASTQDHTYVVPVSPRVSQIPEANNEKVSVYTCNFPQIQIPNTWDLQRLNVTYAISDKALHDFTQTFIGENSLISRKTHTAYTAPKILDGEDAFLLACGHSLTSWREHEFRTRQSGWSFFLDVSGSMVPSLPFAQSLGSALSEYVERYYQFSDIVLETELELLASEIRSTGGTSFRALAEYIVAHDLEKVIIWSDELGGISLPNEFKLRVLREQIQIKLLRIGNHAGPFSSNFGDLGLQNYQLVDLS